METQIMDNQIGEMIRKLRTKNQLSQEDLAEKLHVTRQAISNWENGKTQPDADTLLRIGSLFQTSMDEIISGKPGREGIPKNRRGPVICCLSMLISLVHLAMGIAGKINVVGVNSSVLCASLIALIVCFSFESMIKSQDFSLLNGFKEKDNADPLRFARQLRSVSLIIGFQALILNILYIPVYFTDRSKHMTVSLVFFGVFISAFISTVMVVNYKYKK